MLWAVEEEEQDASDLGESGGLGAAFKVAILLHSFPVHSANCQHCTSKQGMDVRCVSWPPHRMSSLTEMKLARTSKSEKSVSFHQNPLESLGVFLADLCQQGQSHRGGGNGD